MNDLLERQHGLITTDQLRQHELGYRQISWQVEDGRLERITPRLFRLQGAPRSEGQRLLAAVLDAGPGSALSHTSALGWWGVSGFLLDDIHITHPRDGVHRPRRLASQVHDVVLLPGDHVRVLDGVPVVTPARALFDVAGMRTVHPLRVERAVDNAWAKRLVSGKTLQAMLRRLAKRGRPGITVMREILRERGPDYIPPASGLEHRVVQILREAGLPEMRRQIDSGDEDEWVGRVDFGDDKLPFRLEVQSERFHTSLLDSKADADRLARLEAAGFVVVAVTDIDVWHRPAHVTELVVKGRRQAAKAANLPPFSTR